MQARVKVLQRVAADAALNPMIPATARAAVAELVALAADLVDENERIKRRVLALESRAELGNARERVHG